MAERCPFALIWINPPKDFDFDAAQNTAGSRICATHRTGLAAGIVSKKDHCNYLN
jgi:hypothetical protein